MMSRPLGQALVLLALLAGAGASPSAEEAASGRSRQLALWFLGMGDANPGVREQSRQALLALEREDLEELRSGLAPLAPLDAKRTAQLKEIVRHVWLKGYAYPRDRMGFLGITMGPLAAIGAEQTEVVVDSRMPGFCAYAALEDGDAIVDIEEHPLKQPVQRGDFTEAIKEMSPGEVVHLKVLRQGQILRIGLRLDARPAERGENGWDYEQGVQEMLGKRWGEAEKYWESHFASLGTRGKDE